MTVTHLDGFPIDPQEGDSVLMSMGERVNVLVQPTSGVWPIMATPEGKDGAALAWLRTSDSNAATPEVGDRSTSY